MIVRFGAWELDMERATLRKSGIAVRLREQAIRVLIALVERPGELVTREELRERLWTHGTFVDFEAGLNTAISRLREVLDDPAASPHYIGTVPKRGYRFIGPVARQYSLAVMPFLNRTQDHEADYLCDGLTEELIRACWRIAEIRVAGQATVSRFRRQTYDLVGAARELGVDFILEGSIDGIGDRIRISVHLVSGKDGLEILGEQFDGALPDAFAMRDRVTNRIAGVLESRLTAAIPGDRPENSEAYTAYLKGHFLIKRHNPVNSAKALQYFDNAIEADPGYALSYHGAAIVYILDTLEGILTPRDGMARAERLLEKGLAIQKDSAMLQNTLAMLRMFQCKWKESEEAYRRAIDLEPSNPHPHMMFALHHSFCGRHEEARREARTALNLDPVDPMMNFRVVQTAYYARRYDDAIQSAHTAIDLAPEFHPPRLFLAFALLAAGREEEAWRAAQKSREMSWRLPFYEGQFGYMAGKLGHAAETINVIEDLTARRERGYAPALPIAWAWLGLNDLDSCRLWLETAIQEQEPYLAAAAVSPIYDPLRSGPAFKRLLTQLGMKQVNAGIGP
ncbi:MAG TPA: winged helix-turn-helix domain-containing protein [Bryobacteraceae bacterium]|nr:winged helix-turn-helix domain-containing protein [Bryobacteraceae bacterium]